MSFAVIAMEPLSHSRRNNAMKHTDPRIDEYIANAPAFARPILEKLRKAFHAGAADIEETIKWGVPSFEKKGMVGGFAAFKKHVGYGFWKAEAMDDPAGLFGDARKKSPMSIKVSDVKELPTQKVLAGYVRQAVKLNVDGVKAGPMAKRKKASKKPAPKTPADLAAALKKNKKAHATFQAFSPSHKREYIEWITEAKRQETRDKRLAQAIEWMADGKSRNWKYR